MQRKNENWRYVEIFFLVSKSLRNEMLILHCIRRKIRKCEMESKLKRAFGDPPEVRLQFRRSLPWLVLGAETESESSDVWPRVLK